MTLLHQAMSLLSFTVLLLDTLRYMPVDVLKVLRLDQPPKSKKDLQR